MCIRDRCSLSAFGWDSVDYSWLPVRTGPMTGISPRVLEDTAEYTISIDEMGRMQKLCKQSATIPLPLDYPVRTMDDWLNIKHWYQFRQDRIDREGLLNLAKRQKEGTLVIAGIPGAVSYTHLDVYKRQTGTITLGNRQACAFIPVDGADEQELADAAQLSSLADEDVYKRQDLHQ